MSDTIGCDEVLFPQVLDHFAIGILIVDRDGRVLKMNTAAGSLLSTGKALSLDNGRLKCRGAGIDLLSENDASATSNDMLHDANRLLAASLSGGSLHLRIHPLTNAGRAAAAIYVADSSQPLRADESLLRRHYHFSPAELRVAQELLQGRSAQRIAEALSVSTHTVRTHLKAMFAKTGARRQSELIRMMSGGLLSSILQPAKSPI